MSMLRQILKRKIYSVCNGSAHAGDHDDTASVPKPDHLFCYRLSGHENSRDINRKHFASIISAVDFVH